MGVPGLALRSVTWGGDVLAIATLVVKKGFAHLAVDIGLIALNAMPVLVHISTEFQRERNVGSTVHQ